MVLETGCNCRDRPSCPWVLAVYCSVRLPGSAAGGPHRPGPFVAQRGTGKRGHGDAVSQLVALDLRSVWLWAGFTCYQAFVEHLSAFPFPEAAPVPEAPRLVRFGVNHA